MRRLAILFAIMLGASGCGNLGLGQTDCGPVMGDVDVSSSNILTAQAVPTAKYTPCVNELRLGWDQVDWFAEDGRAGIKILRFSPSSTFLTATVTESCDVSDAVAAESGFADIDRFEDIELQPVGIRIAIVPSGEGPLSSARQLADELSGVDVDGRPVSYTIDEAIDEPVSSRVELALSQFDYVLIIDEVDAEDGTVQLSSNFSAASGHDLDPRQALDLIDGVVPEVFYRGYWYFTFEGGCITYDFDASGDLAETIAQDAEESLGFFPAQELRRVATEQGYYIG
ncbi:hypothetical protein [Ilumatobacter sp.]|uniref:hypothetical protein n=1 Tax=Ilumatobacter sp. TaxID=1967498 RepID=UPI003AF9083C